MEKNSSLILEFCGKINYANLKNKIFEYLGGTEIMKRYKLVFFLYITFFVFLNFSSLSVGGKNNDRFNFTLEKSKYSSEYWFSIYYKDRYWLVDKNGLIYDVYQESSENSLLKTSPFISGVKINDETGEVDKKMLEFIPKEIPKVVFEINLSEKYITTTKSSIIYLTDIEDVILCLSVLRTVGDYLDPGKVFVFKNGKLYLL